LNKKTGYLSLLCVCVKQRERETPVTNKDSGFSLEESETRRYESILRVWAMRSRMSSNSVKFNKRIFTPTQRKKNGHDDDDAYNLLPLSLCNSICFVSLQTDWIGVCVICKTIYNTNKCYVS
jgi:hypothetical protein